MLEIPESNTMARQLREVTIGKKIRTVQANTSPHGFAFYTGNPVEYQELLEGLRIDDAKAEGGQVEIYAENCRILFSDGANIRYVEVNGRLPKKHQLLIAFEDGSDLVCTVQMYAVLGAFIDGEYESPYYQAAQEKPSPLSEGFDEVYFERLLSEAKKGLSAKAFLATEQRIPGLGNGVLQDILFCGGIHPKTKLELLSDEELIRMFRSVKQTLKEMTDQGGRNTEKDLFGMPGGYRTMLSNKTWTDPCPVCGDVLHRQAYLGGNIYFCPTCQQLRK